MLAQEKPAMAATPMPPSSPCLTMLVTGALACWMALGAASRNTSPRQRRSSMEKRNGPVSRVRRKYHSMNRHPATWERAVAAAAPATPEGPYPGEVQQDVQHRGGQHGVQGRFRVAAGHHQLFGQVVDHQEGQPRQVKADVLRCLGQDLGGGADSGAAAIPPLPARPPPCTAPAPRRWQQVVDCRRQLLRGGGGPPGGQQQAAAQLIPPDTKRNTISTVDALDTSRQGAPRPGTAPRSWCRPPHRAGWPPSSE